MRLKAISTVVASRAGTEVNAEAAPSNWRRPASTCYSEIIHLFMSTGFPRYTSTARKGEAGVNLVSKIVSDVFAWIFKRNHQEHDFGIDGQFEIVNDGGSVTGQIISAQIKYGASFFKENNRWGYVYRGELKHFNYLSNYPTPVIIVICEPVSKDCYWARFVPEEANVTEGGWNITIPFQNRLSSSKDLLLNMVGQPLDSLTSLSDYWALNKLIVNSSFLLYILDDHDVCNNDITRPRAFFDRLLKTKEIAFESQGKVEFVFSGYDDDPRELFEIKEVQSYVDILDRALAELFFFVRTDDASHTLRLFALCLARGKWAVKHAPPSGGRGLVFFDTPLLEPFFTRHFIGLNYVTEWLGMSVEDNEAICSRILSCLGLQS